MRRDEPGASRRRRMGARTRAYSGSPLKRDLRVADVRENGDDGSTRHRARRYPPAAHRAACANRRQPGESQQRNRALALLLATVALFAFLIVIALVVFLHDEALHPLANL